jgi:urea transport system substrate-binding protein
VEKLAPSDINPPNIREAVKGVELVAPQGKVRLDPATLHTYLWPKIGVCKSDGQFEILEQSSEWLAPVPYKAYPNQVCTEEGLKET